MTFMHDGAGCHTAPVASGPPGKILGEAREEMLEKHQPRDSY